jgi:hypothetical protein
MANFTLNINGQVDDGYLPIRYIITEEEDCAIINKTIPLGVLESFNEPDIIFLLQSWGRGVSWKTFKIKDIVYSNGTDFYLEDGGVLIPEAGSTPYDINVTGIGTSLPITDFLLKFNNLDLTQNETINFKLAVVDLNDVEGNYYPVTISLQRIKCPTPPVANYVAFITADTDCTTTCDITIACPDEEQRRVEISFTGTPGYQTVDLVATPVDEIITTPTVYQLAITADRSIGTSFTSNILVEIFPDATFPIALDSYILTRQHNSTLC